MPIERSTPHPDTREYRTSNFIQKKTSVLIEQKVRVLSPDQKETRLIKETYALKDKKGGVACLVEVAFRSDVKQEHNSRILESLELWKGGKKIDLLELADLEVDVKVHVLTDPKIEDRFSYQTEYKNVNGKKRHTMFVPPLDSFTGIAIALHEFGHAKQDESPYFVDLKILDHENGADVVHKAEKVIAQFPELKDQMPSDDVAKTVSVLQDAIETKGTEITQDEAEMDRMRRERDLLQKKSSFLANKISLVGFFERRKVQAELKEVLARLEELKKRFLATQEKSIHLRQTVLKERRNLNKIQRSYNDVAFMPRRFLERDATRRAFVWMNQIEKTIGLQFKSLPVPETSYRTGDLVARPNCANSTKRAMEILQKLPEAEQRAGNASRGVGDFSARDYLLYALGTYDAFEKIPPSSLKQLNEIVRAEEKKRKTKSPGP